MAQGVLTPLFWLENRGKKSNLSKEEVAQSGNFGGEEPVMQSVGPATRSSEPMAIVNKDMGFICSNPGLGDTRSTKQKTDEIYQKLLKIAEETGDAKTALMVAEGREELRR